MQLTPNALAWLGLASVAIGGAVRMLKSDSMNAVIVRFGGKPIPKRALPWVSLGLGVTAGVIAGLQQGHDIISTLTDAVAGLGSGVFAVAGHELLIESAANGNEIGGGSKPNA